MKEEIHQFIPDITYKIIRSSRKSISLQIGTGNSLIIRAPKWLSDTEIHKFIISKEKWIKKHLADKQTLENTEPKLTYEEINILAQKAIDYIPERVRHYAPLVGVTYGRITIRNQKTRWGSCSSKGNLNFNCLLMLTPPEVIDSVIVHELCHRKEMNHSKRFYEEIYKVYPEYDKWNKWLTQNGKRIMARMY